MSIRTPRALRPALRTAVALHAVALAAQPALAGLLLTGHYTALTLHALVADVVFTLGLVQCAPAVLLGLRSRIWWPAVVTGLVAVGETVQYLAGLDGALHVHLPLGVALVAATAVLAAAVWRPAPAADGAADTAEVPS